MALKRTLHKKSSKQSLFKISSEAAGIRCPSKQVFLKISQQENSRVGVCFEVEKEIPTQVFSCEYFQVFKSSVF